MFDDSDYSGLSPEGTSELRQALHAQIVQAAENSLVVLSLAKAASAELMAMQVRESVTFFEGLTFNELRSMVSMLGLWLNELSLSSPEIAQWLSQLRSDVAMGLYANSLLSWPEQPPSE